MKLVIKDKVYKCIKINEFDEDIIDCQTDEKIIYLRKQTKIVMLNPTASYILKTLVESLNNKYSILDAEMIYKMVINKFNAELMEKEEIVNDINETLIMFLNEKIMETAL